jgi:aminoglycoside phosphotransferase (APT) family kinase protein
VTASPTQRDVTVADIAALAREAFGPATTVENAQPLSGGGFASVWRVDLADGRRTVVKIGPAADVPLLRYERDMVAAEAAYLAVVADAGLALPLPRLLRNGSDWLFATHLPGVPLNESPVEDGPIRRELGAVMAKIHTLTGAIFGYTGERSSGDTWPEAFAAMIEDLLADADDWSVRVPAETIRDTVERHRKILDQVDLPALLHFDLWDGNVLVDGDRLSGLVDGERWLYGDPLMDFVSPAIYRRIDDEPGNPFVAGYREVSGRPPVGETDSERRRLALYRLHLYLVMTVEMPSRGMTTARDEARRHKLSHLLDGELAALR